LPRKEVFKAHKVAEATSYRILKSKSPRRSDRIHNRGRKPVLARHKRESIETVEDSSFCFGTATHYVVARSIGLDKGSERAIQRNMAEHGVGIYMAQQKKFISQPSIEKRGLWGFNRRYWHKDNYKHYKFSDECHFACGLQRQAHVHR
jgi:hypothetical protein